MKKLNWIFLLPSLLLFSHVLFGQEENTNRFSYYKSIDHSDGRSRIEEQIHIFNPNDIDRNQYMKIITEFYSDYNIYERYTLVNYMLEDLYTSFYKNGKPNEIYFNKNGNICGLYNKFYENGNIETAGMYDTLSEHKYETVIINDSIWNQDTQTYDKLHTIWEKPINLKTGKWYYYNENGEVKLEENYLNGILINEK